MKYYAAIDLGASSGRVILASLDAGKITTEVLHRFQHPILENEGKYHWDLDLLFREILTGLGKASAFKLESIGIDTWGVDFCKVLPDGTLAAPRSYRDPYTDGVPEDFFRSPKTT